MFPPLPGSYFYDTQLPHGMSVSHPPYVISTIDLSMLHFVFAIIFTCLFTQSKRGPTFMSALSSVCGCTKIV